MGKLSVLKVKSASPGIHGDGDGLYLRVKPSGARSWVLRVQHNGRREDIGLGSLAALSLAEARDKAAEFRKLAKTGKNARVERDRGKVTIPTFAQALVAAHGELAKGWIGKTGDAFKASLEQYVVPKLGKHRVDAIGSAEVIAALAPVWTDKPALAKKLRVRIVQVLAFAKAHGWREAALPDARELRDGLSKQRRGGNFAAMPFKQVPAFVDNMLAKEATAGRLALVFTILTACRSGEARLARWEQFDREANTWTRPAEVMKSKVAHVVTLSDAALEILDRAESLADGSGLVFPGSRRGSPLSDMTLTKALRDTGEKTVTVHGFRSAFRDWAAEQMPTIPAMVAEMALAHRVGTATEQAYLRSDLRDMRRALMDAWAQFTVPTLASAVGNVVPIRGETAA